MSFAEQQQAAKAAATMIASAFMLYWQNVSSAGTAGAAVRVESRVDVEMRESHGRKVESPSGCPAALCSASVLGAGCSWD